MDIAKNIDLLASPQERGHRLRVLRECLKLSREAFEEKTKISARTLQNWEIARHNGLTKKGAEQIIQALNEMGIPCSIEWLYYGVGPEPLAQLKPIDAALSAKDIIALELKYFHQQNKDTIDYIVQDDLNAPFLGKGDIVAGKRYFDHDIPQFQNNLCIVQTYNHETLVRCIEITKKQNFYDLASYCYGEKKLTYKEIQLISAAPIIWVRKIK